MSTIFKCQFLSVLESWYTSYLMTFFVTKGYLMIKCVYRWFFRKMLKMFHYESGTFSCFQMILDSFFAFFPYYACEYLSELLLLTKHKGMRIDPLVFSCILVLDWENHCNKIWFSRIKKRVKIAFFRTAHAFALCACAYWGQSFELWFWCSKLKYHNSIIKAYFLKKELKNVRKRYFIDTAHAHTWSWHCYTVRMRGLRWVLWYLSVK